MANRDWDSGYLFDDPNSLDNQRRDALAWRREQKSGYSMTKADTERLLDAMTDAWGRAQRAGVQQKDAWPWIAKVRTAWLFNDSEPPMPAPAPAGTWLGYDTDSEGRPYCGICRRAIEGDNFTITDRFMRWSYPSWAVTTTFHRGCYGRWNEKQIAENLKLEKADEQGNRSQKLANGHPASEL